MIPDTTNLNTYTHNVKKMNMIHIQPQEEKPIRPMPDHPCISLSTNFSSDHTCNNTSALTEEWSHVS
jgi:hypothetical protein